MLDAHPKYCIRRRYKTKNEAKPRMENSATPLRPYANSFVKMNNIPWCLPIRPGTSRTSSKRSLPSIGLYPKSRRMCKHVRKHATKGSTVSRLFLSFLPSFLSFFLCFFIFNLLTRKSTFPSTIHEKLDRGRDENRFIPEHALVVLFYGDKSLLTPIGKRFFDRALSVSRGEKTERYRELRRLKVVAFYNRAMFENKERDGNGDGTVRIRDSKLLGKKSSRARFLTPLCTLLRLSVFVFVDFLMRSARAGATTFEFIDI